MPGSPESSRAQIDWAAFSLVIFDKGGTLIDFRAMWTGWAMELAQRLETRLSFPVARQFFDALEFDPHSGRIAPLGPLATFPMSGLRILTADVMTEAGLSREAADALVTSVWFAPDPIATAHPLADLPALCRALRDRSVKIAIATMDDRASTEGGLTALGIKALVDAMVCADDGLPHKPAPEMVWAVCRMLGLSPSHTVVVGDSVTDMQMGRSAGAGLVVGVLSGITPAELLAPHADVLISSVSELI
jgi:phosphoglycolate phosphatase